VGHNPGTDVASADLVRAWGAPNATERPTTSATKMEFAWGSIGPGYPVYATGRSQSCFFSSLPRCSLLSGFRKPDVHVNVYNCDYKASDVPTEGVERVCVVNKYCSWGARAVAKLAETLPLHIVLTSHFYHPDVNAALEARLQRQSEQG